MLITALEKSDDKTRASLQEWLKAEDYVPAQKIELLLLYIIRWACRIYAEIR